MPWDVLELSIAHEDGAPPAAPSTGSSLGASGVCLLSAGFERALHVGAISRRVRELAA
jgi:hypothetical protein